MTQNSPLSEDDRVDPVLCYVRGCWAYFTTQPLEAQWGDDWDDAPYEHNAGCPYLPYKPNEHWEIHKLAFEASLETPDDGVINSSYSVRDINRGAVAWLRDRWSGTGVIIPAGTPMSKFKELVRRAKGTIYVEEKA